MSWKKTTINNFLKPTIDYNFSDKAINYVIIISDNKNNILIKDKHTLGFQLVDFVHTFNDVMEPKEPNPNFCSGSVLLLQKSIFKLEFLMPL